MAQFKNMYKVELNNGIAPVVSLKQIYYADVEANRIGAIVTMNGQPFPLSGTCTGSAILADGSTVPMAGVIDGNQAYIDLDSSCYSVEGQIKIFVKITTGGVTTTLLAAVGTVQLTETDTVIDPGTIIPSVSALITAIEEAVESIPADYTALLETIAPLYANLTFPVKAGQWCWYSGVLYEANQDISTSENWTAAHWGTTTVGGSVSELKSAVYHNENNSYTWTKGTISASDGSSSTSYNRIRTAMIKRPLGVYAGSGYKYAVYVYDTTVTPTEYKGLYTGSGYVKSANWLYGPTMLTGIPETYSIRLLVGMTNDSTSITASDGTNLMLIANTDTTLSLESVPADAKVTGDRFAEVKKIIDFSVFADIDLEWTVGKMINGSGVVYDGNYSAVSSFTDRENAYMYTGATTDGTHDLNIFLHEYIGNTWDRRTQMTPNVVLFPEATTTKVRFSFAYGSSSGLTMTQEIIDDYFAAKYAGALAKSSDVRELQTDVGGLQTDVESIIDSLTASFVIDKQDAEIFSGRYLNSIGVFDIIGFTDNIAFYPIPSGTKSLTIKASTKGSIYTLTRTTNHSLNTAPSYATGYSGRESIVANAEVTISPVPADAKYVYYAIKTNSGDTTPTITAIVDRQEKEVNTLEDKLENLIKKYVSNIVSGYSFGVNSSGRDIPKNRGVMNALRKLEQIRYTQYTLEDTLPNVGDMAAPTGTVTGMVYSSVKEMEKFVPFDVSWVTFMSAVKNPRSLLYTEDVRGSRSQSEYGFTYHGVNDCGPYYGSVCTSTVEYALGFKLRWETVHYDYLARAGIFTDLKDVSAYSVQLCDVLWKDGHVAIVFDIYRDERGIPTSITIMESAGNKATSHTYNSAEAFNSFLASNHYTHIYRYNFFDENTEYTPTPFVTIDDELGTPESYTYNDYICTFAGDYAAFRVGETIYLNVLNAADYTSIVISDGTTEQSVSLVSGTTDYNITALIIHAGFYTAYLTDGTNNSPATHFEAVEATIAVSVSGGLSTVTVNPNANPLYVKICTQAGATRGIYDITDDKSQYTFDADALCTEQTGSVNQHPYYAVIYQGQYGRVMSQMVAID